MSLDCTREDQTLYNTIIQVFLLGVILVVGVLLNVKTFFVILKQKRGARKAVTIFLLNLTLISGLIALFLIPFNIYTIIEKRWVFGNVFCQINGFANVFLCVNVVFTLLCMTIDRYLSVMKPLKHRVFMTRTIAFRMLVAVYVVSFLLAVMPTTGQKTTYEYHPGTNHCSPTWHKSCAYYFTVLSLSFIIPILGMLITYTRIIMKVRSNRSRIGQRRPSGRDSTKDTKLMPGHAPDTRVRRASDPRVEPVGDAVTYRTDEQRTSIVNTATKSNSCTFQEIEVTNVTEGLPSTSRSVRRHSMISSVIRHMRQHETRLPQEYKIARVGFILVLSFTILWMPYLIAHSCFNEKCRTPILFNISMILVYLNAVTNPIIYALTNRTVMRDFRSCLKLVCHC